MLEVALDRDRHPEHSALPTLEQTELRKSRAPADSTDDVVSLAEMEAATVSAAVIGRGSRRARDVAELEDENWVRSMSMNCVSVAVGRREHPSGRLLAALVLSVNRVLIRQRGFSLTVTACHGDDRTDTVRSVQETHRRPMTVERQLPFNPSEA